MQKYGYSIGLLIFFLLVICRQAGILQFHCAKFKYPDIMTVLYDREWHGSPYNIREVSTYRWFEEGMFQVSHDPQEVMESIVHEFAQMRLDISLDGFERIIDHDAHIEVCIEELYYNLELVEDGWLTDTYYAEIDADVQIFNGYRSPAVYDYAIKFTAPIEVSGLTSEAYIKQSVHEFSLYRMLHLLRDYFSLS